MTGRAMARGLFLAAWGLVALLAQAQTLPDQSRDRTLGVVSCSSSLCHGSVSGWSGSPVNQNEYVVWSRLDKHARAQALLLNDLSRRMAANLGLPQPAHESKVCLDCHAHNPAVAATASPAHSVADGVGCEACHGPAERWIAAHTEPGATHQSNVSKGLYPTAQPLARAKLCLSCHFGSSEKYVTHRMMAAGHPRISFEMETFTSLQPAHFNADADYVERKGRSDGVEVWAIGQAVAVSTQIDILLHPQRGRDGIFPELTLFDCHACHHPMSDKRWKPVGSFGKSISPGLVRLNDSSLLMLNLVLRQTDPALAGRLSVAVAQLNQAMAGQGMVQERALALKAVADEAARKISASGTRTKLQTIALTLIDDGLAGSFSDYAGAEQATMALGSLVNNMHKLGQLKSVAAVNKGLADLRSTLLRDEAYKPAEFVARLRAFRPLVASPTNVR